MAMTEEIAKRGRQDFLDKWKKSHNGEDYVHKCADGCGRRISQFMIWCRKCGVTKKSQSFVSRF